MKGIRSYTSLLILVICAVILSACGNSAETDASEKITLKLATHTNLEHYSYKYGAQLWMDRVEELTDGQVDFEVYSSEQAGKAKDSYKLTESRVVDISFITYAQNSIPLTDLPMLPGLYEDAYAGTHAFWEIASEGGIMYEEVLQPRGLRPIFTFAVSPYTFGTVDKKIETIDDINGQLLRTSGGLTDLTLNELEGTPVNMAVSDTRQALETSTVDGILTSWLSVTPYQLEGPLNYMISNAPLNGWAAFYAINEDVYAELPQHVKEAMDAASEETVESLATSIETEEAVEFDKLEESGVELYEIDEEEAERWKEALTPLVEEWLDDIEENGDPAYEIYNRFLELTSQYSE